MGKIRGVIVDAASGARVEAKVQVLSANGRTLMPRGVLEKRGPGQPFFYCDGAFEVESARGQVDVTVERGPEYTPFHARDGWIAARCSGRARDSFNQAIYAHTSPVYVRNGLANRYQRESAQYFIDSIGASLEWVRHTGRFAKDEQRDAVVELFLEGQMAYEKLLEEA